MTIKKRASAMMLSLMIAYPAVSGATLAVTKPPLSTQIKQVFAHAPVGPHWGLWIKDLTTGRVLYRSHVRDYFTPASTMKLLTAVAAADTLGEDFAFSTRLGLAGTVKDGVLHGDVVLEMSGDPTLTNKDLYQLLFELKRRGIAHITGRVLVNTSHFKTMPYAPGWMWDELSYEYAVPMGALVIDANEFVVRMAPKPNRRRPVLQVIAPAGVVHVSNQITLTNRYNKWCPLTVYSNALNQYKLGGCLVRAWGKQVRVLAIRDPWSYVKQTLVRLLKEQKISLKKGIYQREHTPTTHWISVHHSAALPALLKIMLKESNNLIADTLFLELGRHHTPSSPNWQGGAVAMHEFLKNKLGIAPSHTHIVDGSGLSRYNLLSPEQLSKLLMMVSQNKKLWNIIYPALPIAGQDGTLAWRMRKSPAKHKVHAKTGSMTGLSALTGFVTTSSGHRLAFAVMMNGAVSKIKTWRPIEDELMALLVKEA